ncbi:MAG: HlyD family efflux transporter periplasmic adaptor subunit [Anaerolineaceae bacterium]|nr:HlyD family efflux transporter periplasmic adaptor subunit [Anaerolineaceae bacterium]
MNKQRIIFFSIAFFLMISLSACTSGSAAAVQPTNDEVSLQINTNPQFIIAEGIVLPAQSARLSFMNSGVVDEILAKEGDSLKNGDTIARLSGFEQLNAQVATAEFAVLDAQQALDSFMEEDALNRANAELALAQAQQELQDAQDHLKNKDLKPASQLTLDGLQADYVLALENLNDAEDEYRTYEENRDDTDPVRARALLELVEARRSYEKVANNLNLALGFPDADAVEEAQSKLSLAQAKVDIAQLDYDIVKDGPDADQLELLQTSLNAAQAQLASAQRDLQDIYLTAPFAGTLVASALEVGEFISVGSTVAEIGTLDEWIIKTTDLTELDIVSIHVGDKVTAKFDALPEVALTGTVDKIKMYGIEQQGNIIYTITVIPDEYLEELRWNMTAFLMFERE